MLVFHLHFSVNLILNQRDYQDFEFSILYLKDCLEGLVQLNQDKVHLIRGQVLALFFDH